MKTILQGKNISNVYSVVANQKEIKVNGETKTVFTAVPELKIETRIDSWEDISGCSFDCPISGYEIYLSESESVQVYHRIYRADLNALVLQTTKILTEVDVDKESSEETYNKLIMEFNKSIIESNEEMSAYCKLHKLDPAETDVDVLFELLNPDKVYKIIDGKLSEQVGLIKIYLQS